MYIYESLIKMLKKHFLLYWTSNDQELCESLTNVHINSYQLEKKLVWILCHYSIHLIKRGLSGCDFAIAMELID